MNDMLSICFLISTTHGRIKGVEHLLMPAAEGVSYVVAWQLPAGEEAQYPLPEGLKNRDDVTVLRWNGKGLSANRNYALDYVKEHSLEAKSEGRTAPDLLVIAADDDNRYSPSDVQAIRSAFTSYPEADIIHFEARDYDGLPLRTYPSEPLWWTSRRRLFSCLSSCCIVVRNSPKLPAFDTRFGLGAYLGCAEEELYVHEAIVKGGLRCLYLPVSIVRTAKCTTASRLLTDASVARAKGALLYVLHGWWGAQMRVAAFCLRKSQISFRLRMQLWHSMREGIEYMAKNA